MNTQTKAMNISKVIVVLCKSYKQRIYASNLYTLSGDLIPVYDKELKDVIDKTIYGLLDIKKTEKTERMLLENRNIIEDIFYNVGTDKKTNYEELDLDKLIEVLRELIENENRQICKLN